MELEQGGSPAAEPGEEEVTLREFTLSDADAEVFMSWASDPRVARFKRRDPYEHVDQARRYIAAHVLPHPWYRAICAGNGGRGGRARAQGVRGAGYRVARAHWGRGVATRAVRAAAAAVFAAWPRLVRLEAVADEENPASQRVLEKAGFVREGTLRKHIVLKGRPSDMGVFLRFNI